MPQRAIHLLIALLGALAVAAIVLLGYDVYRSARAGPRWKRRLLGAGLALLTAIGLPACESGTADAAPTATEDGTEAETLADAAGWKRLTATWRDSEAIASGKRGPYPFDEKGKKRALAALDRAVADVGALVGAGLLTNAEAGLLKLDLAELKLGVQAKRPTEMRGALCYQAMLFRPARDSLNRLKARTPLIEKLAAAETVQPAVVGKVLAAVERDLATLAEKRTFVLLPMREQPAARKLCDDLAATVVAIKAKLPKPE
jgi:hypothetical protein